MYLQISLTTDQINIPHPGKLFIGHRFFLAPKISLENSGAAGINKNGYRIYIRGYIDRGKFALILAC